MQRTIDETTRRREKQIAYNNHTVVQQPKLSKMADDQPLFSHEEAEKMRKHAKQDTDDTDPTENAGYSDDQGDTAPDDFRLAQGKGYAAPVAAEGDQVETGGKEEVSGPMGGDGEGGPARNTSAAPPDWTGARY